MLNFNLKNVIILLSYLLILIGFLFLTIYIAIEAKSLSLNLASLNLASLNLASILLLLLCIISLIVKSIINFLQKESKIAFQSKTLNNFTIIPYYQPPSNIHPAIAGFLIDKNIGEREFFATLFNLIINGNIAVDEKIINGEYKYFLIKNKGFKKNISCDRLVSSNLFKNKDFISFENLTFQTEIITDFIKDSLFKLGYFENPYNIIKDNKPSDKIKWIESIERAYNRFSFLSINKKEGTEKKELDKQVKLINEFYSRKDLKPLKKLKREFSYTKLGAEERAKWLGFKGYLQTAERFRLNEEKVETFSKYLPYAVALGVETEWTKRFEDMNINRTEWFRSQESETIRRHDSQKVYFKHLVKFLGQIYVK